jgi:hypothetical protein
MAPRIVPPPKKNRARCGLKYSLKIVRGDLGPEADYIDDETDETQTQLAVADVDINEGNVRRHTSQSQPSSFGGCVFRGLLTNCLFRNTTCKRPWPQLPYLFQHRALSRSKPPSIRSSILRADGSTPSRTCRQRRLSRRRVPMLWWTMNTRTTWTSSTSSGWTRTTKKLVGRVPARTVLPLVQRAKAKIKNPRLESLFLSLRTSLSL